jgi:hypothetical protein
MDNFFLDVSLFFTFLILCILILMIILEGNDNEQNF